jgi:hypothetical protein
MADGRFGCEADMAGPRCRLDPVARDPNATSRICEPVPCNHSSGMNYEFSSQTG